MSGTRVVQELTQNAQFNLQRQDQYHDLPLRSFLQYHFLSSFRFFFHLPSTTRYPNPSPKASEQSEDTETEEEADDGENAASGGDGGGAGSNTGVIVGSIIGVVMAVLLIGGAVWWFYFRQQNSEREPRYVVKMEKEHEPTVIENVAYGAAYN